MSKKRNTEWVPTPTFLYRNYLYSKIAKNLPRDKFFLDVGAGNGMFLRSLSDLGFKGESIDISPEAVRFAREHYRGKDSIKIKLGNIFTYKTSKKYGAIFSFEMLEHVRDDQLALVKMFKLLEKEGTLVLSVPAFMSEWSKTDEIKGHYRRYSRIGLIKKIKKAGFKINKVWTYGFPLLWLVRRFSKSGKFMNFSAGNRDKDSLGRESSIQEEYDPRLKGIITNKYLTFLPFKVMDLFLSTGLGFGFIVVATKPGFR